LGGLLAWPIEKGISELYFRDAQKILRSRPDLIRIGITGSWGKTSVKFILGTMLAEKYPTLVTPASFNTPMGLTRVIRERLTPAHQVFIGEMGARHRRDIRDLCRLVHPTIGISCDVGHASDGPVGDDVKSIGDVRLGKGASLSTGPIYHKGLVAHFRKTAEERKIPMQLHSVPKGAGNNGWALKLERGGVPVVQIAVPLRYMHSPVEVADLRDVESVISLTAAAVLGLDDDFPLRPEQP